MNANNVSARRIARLGRGLIVVPALVLGLSFNVEALTFGGAAGSAAAATETPQRVSAPLKPDWVEALLDARATALRSLLEAHDPATAAGQPR